MRIQCAQRHADALVRHDPVSSRLCSPSHRAAPKRNAPAAAQLTLPLGYQPYNLASRIWCLRTATLLRPKRTGRRVAPAAGLLFEGCASLPVFKATKRPGTVLKILFKYWSAFPQVSTDHRGVLQMQALRRYGSCEEWNCAWLSRPILLRSFSRADVSVELGFSQGSLYLFC